jgi:hypothetical protein
MGALCGGDEVLEVDDEGRLGYQEDFVGWVFADVVVAT